jgi:hypothetical protein
MNVLATHRAAIVAMMVAVPNIGQVHAQERYLPDEGKFKQVYLFELPDGSKQIRGWWLRRVRTLERTVSTGSVMNEHTWQWRGYMAFKDADATELTFDDLIEAYRDAFRADPTLGGVCEQNPLDIGQGEDGVQVVDAGPVTFSSVLCHSAVLQLKTWSYL